MFPKTGRSRPSSSPRAETRGPLLAGVAAFLGSWFFLSYASMFRPWLGGDVLYYENWGHWLAYHYVPYRDFAIEYPPGALPIFAAPPYLRSIFAEHGLYPFWFRVLLLLCGLAALTAMAFVLGRVGASRRRAYAALVLAGLGPVLLGPIALSRYDYWPALLAVAGVAALVGGRPVLACALLAAGTLAKAYPVVLLPLALVELWRRGRGRALVQGIVAALAVLAAGAGPFLVLAPHGLWWTVQDQLGRPLQIESLVSAFLVAAHEVGGLHLHVVNSHGSDNVTGFRALASASTAVGVAALLLVYWLYVRGPATTARLVAACVAAVTAYVAFGGVFSPQYLVWLIPLVPLVGGRAGLRANLVFVAVLGLTQIWSPYHYHTYAASLASWVAWLVVARDLLVVAMLWLLLQPLLRSERHAQELDPAGAPVL
jgi:hypothetical protein